MVRIIWRLTLALLLLCAPPATAQRSAPSAVTRMALQPGPDLAVARADTLGLAFGEQAGAKAVRPWIRRNFWRWTGIGAVTGAAFGAIATTVVLANSRDQEIFVPPVLIVGVGAAYGGGAGGIVGALAYVFSRDYGEKRSRDRE